MEVSTFFSMMAWSEKFHSEGSNGLTVMYKLSIKISTGALIMLNPKWVPG